MDNLIDKIIMCHIFGNIKNNQESSNKIDYFDLINFRKKSKDKVMKFLLNNKHYFDKYYYVYKKMSWEKISNNFDYYQEYNYINTKLFLSCGLPIIFEKIFPNLYLYDLDFEDDFDDLYPKLFCELVVN